jgi:hypothetical protein
VKQAKNLISQLTEAEFVDSKIPGYRWSQQHSDYGGIPQRWLVVESAQRRQSDLRRIEKEIQKLEQEARQKAQAIIRSKICVSGLMRSKQHYNYLANLNIIN